MPDVSQQIFAFSGVLKPKPGDRTSSALLDHALKLAGTDERTRLCYVPTAIGDAQEAVFADGIGLVPYSNGVHDDLDDQPRRQVYREFVASRRFPAGYATEDGVGLHYIGTELREAVNHPPRQAGLASRA